MSSLSPYAECSGVPQVHFPLVVRVYHPYRQPNGTNHCLPVNGQCSHLCLPAPASGSERRRTGCACPAGLRLGKDGRTCTERGQFRRLVHGLGVVTAGW